jgi:hypothetical protein
MTSTASKLDLSWVFDKHLLCREGYFIKYATTSSC